MTLSVTFPTTLVYVLFAVPSLIILGFLKLYLQGFIGGGGGEPWDPPPPLKIAKYYSNVMNKQYF